MEWPRALINLRPGSVWPLVCLGLCGFVAGGCGGENLPTVSGTVTVDGQPLKDGMMQLLPLEGDAPSEATKIQEGRFSLALAKTKYKVQIYAPRVSKVEAKLDVNGPGGGPTMEETLPPRYNVQSELTLDVSGPRSDVRFELKSR